MILSEINDHTNKAWLLCKVGYICWSKYFVLQSSTLTIGHQAIHTSLWLSVSLRIPLSIACSWKKRLVHVRIHYSVRKILIIVVTSLNVQVLIFVSCLEYLPNLAATSVKQRHLREEFVQNKRYKIQKPNHQWCWSSCSCKDESKKTLKIQQQKMVFVLATGKL